MNDRYKFRVWNDMQKCYSQDDHYIDEDGQLNTNGKYIVEQCTGLKDKNGKLIYENDLIKIDDDIAVIKWSEYYARFILESKEDIFDFETTYAKECEVIGNIHENADLLENGK